MELLSLCPYPAAPLVWQLTPSRWVLTVVCKATYALVPGVVGPASEQEPLLDEDAHWDDDPQKSLFAPADMVPFKQRADVMLVGSACARNGQPARSLTARLQVGKIDKSIEVLCPRVRTRDGEVREGKRWTKMPLLYERAAGGPGTDNPVGVHLEGARDRYGQLALPNLQAPGLALPPDKLPPPIGFGPIAATWPGRKRRVPDLAHAYARAPFGEGFDPLFFQAAPPDQQMDVLRPNERIALDNMLPNHSVFVSALPGDKPRARVELRGASPREMALVPDSLWIDTDRGICTVTFRAKVDIEHPEQEGRVLVALAKNDQPIPWARIAPAPPAPSSSSTPSPRASAPPAQGLSTPPPQAISVPPPAQSISTPPPPQAISAPPPQAISVPPPPFRVEQSPTDIDVEMVDSVEVTLDPQPLHETAALPPIRPVTTQIVPHEREQPALPFQPAPPGWQSPAAVPSRPGLPPLPGTPHDLTVTPAFGAPAARHTLPDWEVSSPKPPPPLPLAQVLPAKEPAPPPPPPPPLVANPAWASQTPTLTSRGALPPLGTPPPVAPPPPVNAPPKEPAPLGALDASNAAAGAAAQDSASPRVEIDVASPHAPPAIVVELLWIDPSAATHYAAHPLFVAAKTRLAPSPETPANPDEAARGWVYDILSRGAPSSLSALESVLDAAEEDSPPSPALALVTGTLELCLDEVETLRATALVASALATGDRKLKETIDVANEMLKTPMAGMPDLAESLAARIRDAWNKANRALPADHLAAATERLLVEQRAYQKRDLLDDTWIRALLSADGSPSIPVYLPAKIARRLPLFRRLPARLLAEVVWCQDQYETAPLALRTIALGRLPARARQGNSRPRRR
ncbi:MAG: DUF2169 domain-containing protein [Polyangiaceae bacterium]